jgi:hypothetical protein
MGEVPAEGDPGVRPARHPADRGVGRDLVRRRHRGGEPATGGRVEEVTGRDLSRLDDQVDFFLALQIR